jgi:hypothetical protein
MGLSDFSVKMQDTLASGPFMKIVHVLGDDVHVKHFFQASQYTVSFIGLGHYDLATSLVVKLQHQARIGFEALR